MNLQETFDLAADYHKNSKKYGNGLPYTHHLESVRLIAQLLGFSEKVQAACLLHDTIEDTAATRESLLADGVDPEVVEMVWCVTDGEGKNRKERKEAMFLKCEGNYNATAVKICDRIANAAFCKRYNQDLFNMYIKEHEEFVTRLGFYYTDGLNLANTWDILDDIIYGKES